MALEITRGQAHHRRRPVAGPVFLIGAATDCDLVLGDSRFGEIYAYLFLTEDKVTIRRLGTGPVLRVSGDSVDAAELFDGDRIVFGPFELTLRIEEPVDGYFYHRASVPWAHGRNG